MLKAGCTPELTATPYPLTLSPMAAFTRNEEYRNLMSTQRVLMAHIQRVDIESKDLASCARVLVAVCDQKRVLRMKPKPKDIDTTKVQRRTRPAASAPAPDAFTVPVALPPPTPTVDENVA
jgi:hypothetical protein